MNEGEKLLLVMLTVSGGIAVLKWVIIDAVDATKQVVRSLKRNKSSAEED